MLSANELSGLDTFGVLHHTVEMPPSTLYAGDCLRVLPTLPADSIDAIVTDPPYGLAFMGKDWDHGVPGVEFWRQALRVAKPGAHLVAFGGTRTHHRLMVAIEDAGWEIRDCLMWLYGTGFPKSGACLKPGWEPAILAKKRGTTSPLNVDACRIGTSKDVPASPAKDRIGQVAKGDERGRTDKTPGFDPNIGRWPANLLLDEESAALLDAQTGVLTSNSGNLGSYAGQVAHTYGSFASKSSKGRSDSGGASRFFYCAKASRKDRGEGNTHPTVKPTDLMRWLVRLVTPAGGVVLDPFMGSGSTGKAATLEGRAFVGIDQDPAYVEIARARIDRT